MIENSFNWNGTYYYNSDWHYACEEMQKLFQETANKRTIKRKLEGDTIKRQK